MLWKRLLSAAIGIPFALYILYSGGVLFLFSVIILTFIGQKEIIRIFSNVEANLLVPLLLISGIIFNLTAYYLSLTYILALLVSMVLILFIIFVVKFPGLDLKDVGLNLIAIIYPGLLFSQLILLRNISTDGFTYILLAFIITWSSDTFAYFAGRAFGNAKLAPSLSPAKTIEGAIGGVLGTIMVVIGYNIFFLSFPIAWAILLGAFGSIIAQFGDLFESGIKRLGNVKDSGNLIPGHGGVLDRFDSILFLGPMLYFALYFIAR